jgi:sodium/bile acid cotransporter 7
MKFSNLLKKEWFLLALFSMILLASLWPALGRSGGLLHLDRLSDAGVALIFFLTGLGLSLKELGGGLLRWRVHLLVQLSTFLMFPLLGVGLAIVFGQWLPADLALGFAYLCALPSTISSSIAMTAMARGNVPAAIFNATVSSLIGIVLTPAILVLTAHVSGHGGLSFVDSVLKLGRLVALPLLIGQLSRPLLAGWHHRNKRYTGSVDRAVILLLVLGAFSDSVDAGLWRNYGVELLLEALAGAAVLLILALWLTRFVARRMHLVVEDEIAAVFCGSKKTLASGIPMAKLLFGASTGLGLIVLPIMFYHQLQLIACSVLAGRYARRS